MKAQSALFLLLSDPSDANPVYAPGTVLEVKGKQIVADFLDIELRLVVGQVLAIYFKEGRRFFRRSFRLMAIKSLENGVRVKLFADEKIHSAENRRSERYTTVFEGMMAKFGEEQNCLVLDVSQDGIAIVSSVEYEIDEVVRLEMWVGDTFYAGTCTIRSAIPGQRGRTRYGVQCNPDEGDDNLQHSLSRLWLTLQVRQLENSAPLYS